MGARPGSGAQWGWPACAASSRAEPRPRSSRPAPLQGLLWPGCTRRKELFSQLKLNPSPHTAAEGSAHLRLAPTADSTATVAFCSDPSLTWVGYRQAWPAGACPASCPRPDVDAKSEAAKERHLSSPKAPTGVNNRIAQRDLTWDSRGKQSGRRLCKSNVPRDASQMKHRRTVESCYSLHLANATPSAHMPHGCVFL